MEEAQKKAKIVTFLVRT